MPAQTHAAALADGYLTSGLIVAGSLLMAAATVLGAPGSGRWQFPRPRPGHSPGPAWSRAGAARARLTGTGIGGAGSAGALAVHRCLEGTALALTASLTVTVALAVHALAEGMAVGALLGSWSRRLLAGWLPRCA